jgi:hypothetical protein
MSHGKVKVHFKIVNAKTHHKDSISNRPALLRDICQDYRMAHQATYDANTDFLQQVRERIQEDIANGTCYNVLEMKDVDKNAKLKNEDKLLVLCECGQEIGIESVFGIFSENKDYEIEWAGEHIGIFDYFEFLINEDQEPTVDVWIGNEESWHNFIIFPAKFRKYFEILFGIANTTECSKCELKKNR